MSTLLNVVKKVKVSSLLNEYLEKPIRNTNTFKKEKFTKKYVVSEQFIDEHQILTLTRNKSYNNHIIFLHGGAYRDEALVLHRLFVEKILDKSNFKVSFLDYPLIPEYGHIDTQTFTYKAIMYLKNKYKKDNFYLLGDSAGGGLCVRMLQKINNREIVIKKTVLLSPWVDVSMKNPDIKNQLNKDFTLDLKLLIKCGKKYAGNLKTTSKIVSPIYGKLNNLGEVLIYASDNELLYPDIVKLHEQINNSCNSYSTINVGHDLCHDYPLLIIKESRNIVKNIINFLEED